MSQKKPSEASFEALKLRPGVTLQLQSLAGGETHGVRFIGALKGKSILVTLPVANGQGIRLQPGQDYVIRGFTGRLAYAFEAHPIVSYVHPYAYLHLSYPDSVTSKAVRKALRVKTSLPAAVVPRFGEQPVPITLVDLSISGTMVDSSAPLGETNDVVMLEFPVAFENISTELKLSAVIRSVQKQEGLENLRIGLEFENISHNDSLILRCFVHTIETSEGMLEREAAAK
jgi:c-di-GMP-binding flagellar brake protein YcgR